MARAGLAGSLEWRWLEQFFRGYLPKLVERAGNAPHPQLHAPPHIVRHRPAADDVGDRQAIVEALMRLAAERPWREIEVADVAHEAGISLGELRDHFPSKGAILAAFSRRIDRIVLDGMTDEDLAQPSQTFGEGATAFTTSPTAILSHILLHERGHHGDVTTLLSQLGARVPQTDYLTYEYFRQRRGR